VFLVRPSLLQSNDSRHPFAVSFEIPACETSQLQLLIHFNDVSPLNRFGSNSYSFHAATGEGFACRRNPSKT
jgi:hypothetical protein